MAQQVLLPIAVAAFSWYVATGLLLWLVGRPRRAHPWIAAGATIVLFAAMAVALDLRTDETLAGAYKGFIAGIALWAWHETMFLLGYIAGPRRDPCPPGLGAWPRFLVSTEAVIHHELAIAAHAALLGWMSWGAGNAVAASTFFLLWGMRITAKMVVFLGAPNVSDHLLPRHLAYLGSYFGKQRTTLFFPIIIAIAVLAALALAYLAATTPANGGESVGYTLLATLAALAVFEHLALVLPIQDSALWRWAMTKDDFTAAESGRSSPLGRTG